MFLSFASDITKQGKKWRIGGAESQEMNNWGIHTYA